MLAEVVYREAAGFFGTGAKVQGAAAGETLNKILIDRNPLQLLAGNVSGVKGKAPIAACKDSVLFNAKHGAAPRKKLNCELPQDGRQKKEQEWSKFGVDPIKQTD